jgi:hypothetical protein
MAKFTCVFHCVRIEGGLFGPNLLDALACADLPGQKSADFGLADRYVRICARRWKNV